MEEHIGIEPTDMLLHREPEKWRKTATLALADQCRECARAYATANRHVRERWKAASAPLSLSRMAICANCFEDYGLRLMAVSGSSETDAACSACGKPGYKTLGRDELLSLAHVFFVRGSFYRTAFGGAPAIEFNELQKGSALDVVASVARDVDRLQQELGVGFFPYGPRLWMLGEISQLKDLQAEKSRAAVIGEILKEYPALTYETDRVFYRLRKNPTVASDSAEFDSPPAAFVGQGRLDSPGFPVLYGSEDLELCVHECRVTVDDETYVAALAPTCDLNFLNLVEVLDGSPTEFESLDLTVHMLFLAGAHSYPISRDLARAAAKAGFDGVVYPSFFSLQRTGRPQLDTIYGISARRIPQLAVHERAKIVPNFAIFGRPLADGRVAVRNINRVMIKRMGYQLSFGPTMLTSNC